MIGRFQFLKMTGYNPSIFQTIRSVAMSGEDRIKMAAALVKSNKIISIGINRRKTDPLQTKFSKNPHAIFLHAEIHAIKNALREYSLSDIKGSIMYVCRVKRPSTYATNFIWGSACPCIGCRRGIAEFGIRNVLFTCDDGSIGEL